MEKGNIPLTRVSYERLVKEHDRKGYAIIKESDAELNDEESRVYEKELTECIRKAGYSWLPVVWDRGETTEEILVIFPHDIVKHEWQDDPKIFADEIKELAVSHNMEAFCIKEPGRFPKICYTEGQVQEAEIMNALKAEDTYDELISILNTWLGISKAGKGLYLVSQPQTVMGAHSRYCRREMIGMGPIISKELKKDMLNLNGNAYSSARYLYAAIERSVELPLGVTEPGGTIVFSTDVSEIKNSIRHIADFMKKTLPNPYAASWKISKGIRGRYHNNDKVFDENSIVVDITGINASELERTATELRERVYADMVLVKAYKPEELYVLSFE